MARRPETDDRLPPQRPDGPRTGVMVGAVLGAVGVAVLIVAAIPLIAEWSNGSSVSGFEQAEEGPLFPGLKDRFDAAHTLEIEAQGHAFSMQRSDSGWRMSDYDGYPVRDGAVEAFLPKLADLTATHVSISDQPSHEAYGVVEPSPAHRLTLHVVVRDGEGTALADALIGHSVSVPGNRNTKRMYVRRAGAARVWIADTYLDIESNPLNWLNRELVDVSRGQVREVAAVQPDGYEVELRRGEDGAWTAERGVPADSEVKGQSFLGLMASVLERVTFDGVRAAENLPKDGQQPWHWRVATDDGVTYRIALRRDDSGVWALFSAAPSSEEAGRETRDRIAAFNGRHDGWAYLLPPAAAERFSVQPGDITD